jgi:hypothetical protein
MGCPGLCTTVPQWAHFQAGGEIPLLASHEAMRIGPSKMMGAPQQKQSHELSMLMLPQPLSETRSKAMQSQ